MKIGNFRTVRITAGSDEIVDDPPHIFNSRSIHHPLAPCSYALAGRVNRCRTRPRRRPRTELAREVIGSDSRDTGELPRRAWPRRAVRACLHGPLQLLASCLEREIRGRLSGCDGGCGAAAAAARLRRRRRRRARQLHMTRSRPGSPAAACPSARPRRQITGSRWAPRYRGCRAELAETTRRGLGTGGAAAEFCRCDIPLCSFQDKIITRRAANLL